jgi:hypothetical protein
VSRSFCRREGRARRPDGGSAPVAASVLALSFPRRSPERHSRTRARGARSWSSRRPPLFVFGEDLSCDSEDPAQMDGSKISVCGESVRRGARHAPGDRRASGGAAVEDLGLRPLIALGTELDFGDSVVISAATMICGSLTASWAFVALHPRLALRADHARVVIGHIHQPSRHVGQVERLDRAGCHPPRPVGGDAVRAPVGGVGGPVGIELLLQAPARLKEPVGAAAGDRAPLAFALRRLREVGKRDRGDPRGASRTAADQAPARTRSSPSTSASTACSRSRCSSSLSHSRVPREHPREA